MLFWARIFEVFSRLVLLSSCEGWPGVRPGQAALSRSISDLYREQASTVSNALNYSKRNIYARHDNKQAGRSTTGLFIVASS
jgi:hypothetical protein